MACDIDPKDIFPLIPKACEKAELGTEHVFILVYKAFVLLSWTAEVAAIILLVYAGILYISAAADESKAGTAKKIVTGVIVGLIIILLARWILFYVVQTVGSSSTPYNDININTLTQ